MHMKWKLLLLLFVTLVGCYTVPETGRSALSLVPESQVVSMAVDQFAQMKREMPISDNQAYRDQLQRVGLRIAEESSSGIPPEEWEFVVFASDDLNAFAMPGGKVGVYEGMMELTGTDDRLAVVVGHEVAHVDARHASERLSQQVAVGVIGTAGAIAIEDPDTRRNVLAAYGVGSGLGLLRYSRLHESEADEIGLLYSARAGYDPRVAIDFWQDMADEGGARPPEFLSTHPGPENRVERLRELMPEAVAIYEEAIGRMVDWPVED